MTGSQTADFRESTANWQWRIFAAPGIPDVPENFTGFIGDTLELGDGRRVTGLAFSFPREGMMNLFDVIPGAEGHRVLDRTIVTADFYADRPGTLQLGLGADWLWTLRINGEMTVDARKSTNGEFPVHFTNHRLEFPYRQGRNQLVWEIFSAFRHRGPGGGMDTACRIMEAEAPLDFRFDAFPAFPDAASGAVSVIFTGSRNSPAAVEFRPAGTPSWQRCYDARGGQMRCDRAVHPIRLRGLQPDTLYEYRPVLLDDWRGGREIFGETRLFRSAPAAGAPLRFTATADLQTFEGRTEYLKKILTKETFRPDFFAFLGDLLWTTLFDRQVMEEFVVPFTRLTDRGMPLVMVRGNHEMYGREAGRYFEYFGMPEPGREGYGLFRWGETCFFILDFGDDTDRMPAPSTRRFHDLEPYIDAEAEWLSRAVDLPACREAKYRIVLAHGIPAGDVQHYMPEHVRRVIDPVFGGRTPRCRIHLYLGGHIHTAFRSVPGKRAFRSVLPPEKMLPAGESLPACWANYSFPVLATGGPNGKIAKNMQFTSFEVAVDDRGIAVSSLDETQTVFDRILIAPTGSIAEEESAPEFRYYDY